MITIQSYLYDNIIPVQILDPGLVARTRNRTVYNRTVKLYKNIDNTVTLQVRNQDQKSVDLTGTTLSFYVMNATSNVAILSLTPTINAVKGAATLVISKQHLATLDQEFYNYAIAYSTGDSTLPTYSDDNYGAAGQLQVLDNIFPVN